MGYFYTDHFLNRLEQRGILLSDVQSSLQSPDKHYIKGKDIDVFERDKLRVIVKRRKNHFIFLTVYKI